MTEPNAAPARGRPDTTASASGSGRAWHWLVVVGATCMCVTGQFVYLSASIVNPPLAESLGVTLSEVMVYNSLMAVSGVVAMTFLAPYLFGTLGVRVSVIAGGLFLAVMLGGVALVRSTILLYALGIGAGLTFGIVTTMAASVLVNTWFETSRGTVLGAVFAISGLGGVAAGLILPAFVSDQGWQSGFWFLGLLTVALVVLPGVFLVRSTPAEMGLLPFGATAATAGEGEDVVLPGVPARVAFRSPQLFALAGAIALLGATMAVEMHFVPLMVEHGVSLAAAGTLLSVMALATVATNIVLGTLNDRRGTLFAALLALALMLVGMIGYVFSAGFLPLAVSTVFLAFGLAVPGVLLPIMVMQMFGMRDYSAVLGPVTAMLPAGIAIGTPLWGTAVEVTGSYTAALLVSAVAVVAAALLLAWAIPSGQRLRERVERDLGQTYAET